MSANSAYLMRLETKEYAKKIYQIQKRKLYNKVYYEIRSVFLHCCAEVIHWEYFFFEFSTFIIAQSNIKEWAAVQYILLGCNAVLMS